MCRLAAWPAGLCYAVRHCAQRVRQGCSASSIQRHTDRAQRPRPAATGAGAPLRFRVQFCPQDAWPEQPTLSLSCEQQDVTGQVLRFRCKSKQAVNWQARLAARAHVSEELQPEDEEWLMAVPAAAPASTGRPPLLLPPLVTCCCALCALAQARITSAPLQQMC